LATFRASGPWGGATKAGGEARLISLEPPAPIGNSRIGELLPVRERALSLMAANGATHLIILPHHPIDVIVLAVPVVSADPATETALALVRRLVLTPEAA